MFFGARRPGVQLLRRYGPHELQGRRRSFLRAHRGPAGYLQFPRRALPRGPPRAESPLRFAPQYRRLVAHPSSRITQDPIRNSPNAAHSLQRNSTPLRVHLRQRRHQSRGLPHRPPALRPALPPRRRLRTRVAAVDDAEDAAPAAEDATARADGDPDSADGDPDWVTPAALARPETPPDPPQAATERVSTATPATAATASVPRPPAAPDVTAPPPPTICPVAERSAQSIEPSPPSPPSSRPATCAIDRPPSTLSYATDAPELPSATPSTR